MTQRDEQTLDLDALADVITAAVLAHLSAGAASAGAGGGAGARSGAGAGGPSVGWLLAAPCAHLEAIHRELRVMARLGRAQTVLACSEVAARLGDAAELGVPVVDAGGGGSQLLETAARLDVLLVASLGWRQAAELAAVDDSDPLVAAALEVLTRAAPVYLMVGAELGGLHRLPGRDGQASGSGSGSGSALSPAASGALPREAEARRRELELVGMRPLALGALGGALGRLGAEAEPFARSLGGLVRERDVETAAAEGRRVVQVGAGAVVTPLARDRARELGVRIETG